MARMLIEGYCGKVGVKGGCHELMHPHSPPPLPGCTFHPCSFALLHNDVFFIILYFWFPLIPTAPAAEKAGSASTFGAPKSAPATTAEKTGSASTFGAPKSAPAVKGKQPFDRAAFYAKDEAG